jgi:hypothetical protein
MIIKVFVEFVSKVPMLSFQLGVHEIKLTGTTTLSITTFGITTFSITKLSIMTLSITTLSRMVLVKTLSRHSA